MYYLQTRKPFVVIIFLMIISFWATGQVTYKLTLDADKVTYRVFMKSSAAYVGTQARIGSAQVTIVVPHASTNPFVYGNLKGKTVTNTNTGSTSEMLWSSTRVDSPTENPTFDYISFGFNNSASPILFDISANQEIEILNFKNTGGCTGAVWLFENATDPFKSPNSVNSNPGNSMSIAGNGFGNVYQGNYGGAVNCQATSPDLKITPSGASTITAGSSYSLALAVMNIGTASTSGTYTVQTTLPVGISYSAASGAGWACTPTSQSNGTTLVNCQSSNTLSISSTSNLTLTLAAANTLANNSIVSITGNVSGGGDTNASNNNYSWTPTVINTSAPDLNAVMSGSASITAGLATNYTINVGNLGNAASSGSYSLNVSLPVGINYNSFSGTGWSVVSTAQSDGSTLLVAQSSTVINAGANAVPLVINVTPSASLIGGSTIVYNGSVSGGGDVTPANNSFTFSSTVTSAPKPIFNLSITGVNTILAGTQTTFTYAIANTGSVSTSGVYSLSITLPAGITYNSFTGTGWSINSAPQSNGTTILTAQSSVIINAGANGNPLTINVTPQTTIPNNTTLSLINVLNGGGTTGSVNSTYNITIIQPQNPNLSISITGSSTVTSGSSGNYTIIVTNSGNAPTNGVYTVSTTLPAGVVYNSFTGAGWSVVATLQSNGTTLITATSSTIINAGNSGTPLILNITPNSSANASVSYVISSIISGGGNVGSNTSNFTITVIPNLKPDYTRPCDDYIQT